MVGSLGCFFANECDLDLSSWFIILRCLLSCCFCCFCFFFLFCLYVVVVAVFVRVGVRFCVDLLLPLVVVVVLCGFLLFRLNSFDSSPRLSLQHYKAKMLHRIYICAAISG